MSRQKSSARFRFTGAVLLLAALLFLVPALRNGNRTLYLLAIVVPCGMFLCGTVLARMFSVDRMLLTLSLWLCASDRQRHAPSAAFLRPFPYQPFLYPVYPGIRPERGCLDAAVRAGSPCRGPDLAGAACPGRYRPGSFCHARAISACRTGSLSGHA